MQGLRRLVTGEWNKPPVLAAGTAIVMKRLGDLYGRKAVKEVAVINNGQGLKQSDRDESGPYAVYAAGGRVGSHSNRLTEESFVVIGRKGSAGKPTFAPNGGWVIDTAYYAHPLDDQLSSKFLYYALESCDFSGDIITTAIPGINRTAIYAHPIPVPPRNVQDATISFLDALANGTDLPQLPPQLDQQRRIVAKIERLAAKIESTLELHHLSSKETAFSPQNISGGVFGELQRRFGTTEFRSFGPHISSGPRNWSQYYADEGLRFYRAQDIGPNGEIVDTNPQFIHPPANGQGRSARLEGNDIILVITGATIGRVAVFTPQHAAGLVNQHVGLCRFPLDRVCVRYVLWGLRSPIGQVQLLREKYGQGKPGLNLNNIRSLELPFPPISEQRRIVAYLDGLQAKVDRLKALQAQTRAELDALLPSILDRAFKGEL